MDNKIPQPVHLSYKKHRKELATQIILPIVLAVILIITAIVFINVATFRDGGDVARWAAVSTIWIVIPVMIGMLIFLDFLHRRSRVHRSVADAYDRTLSPTSLSYKARRSIVEPFFIILKIPIYDVVFDLSSHTIFEIRVATGIQ